MSFNSTIGSRRTPSVPIDIILGPQLGLPSANQNILMFGHAAATTPASAIYSVYTVNNVADPAAASAELSPIYGPVSEITKMVLAAINANFLTGGANFPGIKVCALASTDTGLGTNNIALTNSAKVEQEFIVSCYDPLVNTAATTALINQATALSGANNGAQSQFGSTLVVANLTTTSPATLPAYNTQNVVACWLRDTTGANPYTPATLAAACAGVMAALQVPFNPLDGVTIGGVTPSTLLTDQISVGAGLESESCLNAGWTPIKTNSNNTAAFVRTITTRNTLAGVQVTAYFDLQDWMVLYFWRKTLYVRFTQPDFSNVKASQNTAISLIGECLRLANLFQSQNMFESVQQLGQQFQIQRNLSDRSRFDVLTPVNVIPGLHVIAIDVQATTQFDTLTI